MNSLAHDVRYAARTLLRSPGFAVVAVLTLALGIGANSAIFSVVNAALLRPLPYPDADRIVRVYALADGQEMTTSPPDFVDWRRESAVFTEMGAYHRGSYALTGVGEAERLQAALVTAGFFPAMGVGAALGRTFVEEETVDGRDRAVVLSDGLWRRRFGGNPGVLGQTIQLNGESYEVIGVMPPGFEYPAEAELWTPRSFSAEDLATQRGAHYLDVVARLRPGATVDEAAARMRALAARIEAAYAESNTGYSASVEGLRESLVGDARRALLVLLGAVGLVLLIACANVANLSLARALGRERELAIRMALGAGRGRIARALLTESVLLALVGGAAGLLLAVWGVDLLVALQAEELPPVGEVGVDGTVLGFTLGVTLVTGLLFGLVPAARLGLGGDPAASLKEGARGSVSRGGRARSALVVSEMALAVLLLAGAGLLMRSFLKLTQVDPGFETSGLLTFNASLPDARYPEPHQADAFFAELLDRIDALPGVESAGAVFGLPLTGLSYVISVEQIDGGPGYDRPGEEKSVQVRLATPAYFSALRIPLLRGRLLSENDREGAPLVVVVSESAARLLWPGEDPLGHTLELGTSMGLGRGRLRGEVVGVVGDTRDFGLDAAASPQMYAAHSQFPEGFMSVAVRTATAPHALITPIREQLRALDPELPMYDVQTMQERLSDSVAQPRFYLLLLGIFALGALLLGAVGIYGVMAYVVGQRTREIGIRLALGAERRDVLRLVLGRGLGLAAAGVGLGLAGALVLTRTLRGLLYDLSPTDPAALSSGALLLMAVALLASWLPARRAARLDPVVALRAE